MCFRLNMYRQHLVKQQINFGGPMVLLRINSGTILLKYGFEILVPTKVTFSHWSKMHTATRSIMGWGARICNFLN